MTNISTIGYSSSTNSASSIAYDRLRYSWYTTGEVGGYLSKYWLKVSTTWSNSEYGRGAVYVSSSKALVAKTSEFVGDGTLHWITSDFQPSALNANTSYFICYWGDAGSKTVIFTTVADGAIHYRTSSAVYANTTPGGDFSKKTPLNTAGAGFTDGSANSKLNMYVTYTTGEVPVVTTYNGCTAYNTTTATITGEVTNGSGTVWFYWGDNDAESTKGSWDNSYKVGTKYDGNNFSKDLTSLVPGTTYYYRTYISSNWYPTTSDWSTTATFSTSEVINPCSKDLKIYYNSLTGNDFICCDCSRWDTDNYNVIIETWLTKSQLQTLRNNITPGAAGELYQILGAPTFYDQTWQGNNTIRLVPVNISLSSLYNMRNGKTIYVKDVSTSPIEGKSGYLSVKVEGYISGSSL